MDKKNNRKVIFSVDLDDWYHVGWISGHKKAIFPNSDSAKKFFRGESFSYLTKKILKLFNEFKVTTTFFVQGSVASDNESLIRQIYDEGHEIASHDLYHVSPTLRPLKTFIQDVASSKNILEHITGCRCTGYRSPNAMIDESRFRALKQLGFTYDSSVYPCVPIPKHYGRFLAPTQPYFPSWENLSRVGNQTKILEIPLAVIPKYRIPGGSSWYTRNLGLSISKIALRSQSTKGCGCYFFHPYEISKILPTFLPIPRHTFRNTGTKMYRMIKSLLSTLKADRIKFVSASEIVE